MCSATRAGRFCRIRAVTPRLGRPPYIAAEQPDRHPEQEPTRWAGIVRKKSRPCGCKRRSKLPTHDHLGLANRCRARGCHRRLRAHVRRVSRHNYGSCRLEGGVLHVSVASWPQDAPALKQTREASMCACAWCFAQGCPFWSDLHSLAFRC